VLADGLPPLCLPQYPEFVDKEPILMPYGIEYVTVIGAGTMGAAIAGHLANAGIRCSLLDIVPAELTPEEQAAGLSLTDRKVRNRIVQSRLRPHGQGQPVQPLHQERRQPGQRRQPGR
jgi:2-polyprenyl-6-methoxyphenol hydroxylase-like FAD-dependent oxidoreductase